MLRGDHVGRALQGQRPPRGGGGQQRLAQPLASAGEGTVGVAVQQRDQSGTLTRKSISMGRPCGGRCVGWEGRREHAACM